ncbi:MAG: tRNA (N(6)-L-threonylcarbamoyladenosine(37)-C(2))-methylthiotransferase MtaB [Candidatus Aminicenantes bacterium]|nr:tRNA (N(6)-L-threonylcarbamoyladenosine(37)-C(2))-methylthiotransferase MtaB [Candidatus Aminicenantes bacterium]MDH5466211.1 tRNA (N(6)-L-threonylcarbamoyladenosine(37)-C(2))-methylthiotransferase MtaB [Candidatus Aminicenantes bacterium]MDH5704510.1 tRNA (N(6)-L-threonylcarbamoyladenosine(37)-C(2))-methylthiotransferase MtaB [Candidatus Aminicenantes bacterium]
MTSFSIQTFGCRVNQAEAFWWTDVLQKKGLKHEQDHIHSDVVVINSCTLTARADSDTRSFIRRVARLNPGAKMIVTGCYAERVPEELKEMPQVWEVFSNSEKRDLSAKVLALSRPMKQESTAPFRSRALVKIQDGCDYQCTFCVIPSVRGHSVSIEKKEILTRIRELIAQGFKEVVLTGIHLNCYGLDLKPKSSLLDLIQMITCLRGDTRIRLSSLDPRHLEPSLLDLITKSEKICPHFHLSLQSGSDEVLRRMGRKIKAADYKRILSCLREKSPLASLGADIIVGFPGETEEDFQRTFGLLEHSPLTYCHVFSYSPRPGTMAEAWPQVKAANKKQRAASLRALSRKKNMEFRRLFLGKECDGIVIKKSRAQDQVLTFNYFKVFVPPSSAAEKAEVRVEITEVKEQETRGRIKRLPDA